jgi:hypothetical protein
MAEHINNILTRTFHDAGKFPMSWRQEAIILDQAQDREVGKSVTPFWLQK